MKSYLQQVQYCAVFRNESCFRHLWKESSYHEKSSLHSYLKGAMQSAAASCTIGTRKASQAYWPRGPPDCTIKSSSIPRCYGPGALIALQLPLVGQQAASISCTQLLYQTPSLVHVEV